MCGVKLNERKKSKELRELLGLEPVSLMIKKSRLRWFGHVKRKDDNDWVKRCIICEVEGIRQRGRPKKTWWDCVKNDVESLGLCQKRLHSLRIIGEGELTWQLANRDSPWKKWSLKRTVCKKFHLCGSARLVAVVVNLPGRHLLTLHTFSFRRLDMLPSKVEFAWSMVA